MHGQTTSNVYLSNLYTYLNNTGIALTNDTLRCFHVSIAAVEKKIIIFYWSPYSDVVYIVINSRHCVIFLGVRSVIILYIINSSGA